jgi:5-methylcytosine-specific restriction endonuclease McrA
MKEFTKRNLRALGFENSVNDVENKICPLCKSTQTNRKDFDNESSWKEFQLSGICQKCQDLIFE